MLNHPMESRIPTRKPVNMLSETTSLEYSPLNRSNTVLSSPKKGEPSRRNINTVLSTPKEGEPARRN